jgi:hypothetical protein
MGNTLRRQVIGWSVGPGRVLSFSTLLGPTALANASYSRLLSNAVIWASQGEHLQCAGQTAICAGTNGDDVPVGTEGNDIMVGLGGDDLIHGQGGTTSCSVGQAMTACWLRAGMTLYKADPGTTSWTAGQTMTRY